MAERRPGAPGRRFGATAGLAFYERGLSALAPVSRLMIARRARAGGDIVDRIAERRGVPSAPRPDGPLVWIHARDAADLSAVMPLIERIVSLGLWALVTTRTVAAAELAMLRLPEGAIHQLAPTEQPACAERFIAHWRPGLALIGPGELIPSLVGQARRAGAAAVLVDGALSDRTFARWRRARGVIAAILDRFDLCLARTDADAARFADLGAARILRAGDMRLDVEPEPTDPARLARLRATLGRRPLMVAAAAHPGEDALLARAHAVARAHAPDLLTIVTPRRPDEAAGMVEAAELHGLTVSRRARGGTVDPATEIVVPEADADVGLFQRVAQAAFIGGSIAGTVSCDPVMPAKVGAPILHGPHVEGFSEFFAELAREHGAAMVEDPDALGEEAARLVSDPAARAAMADAARAACARLGGALDRTLAAIEPYLFQLRLGQGAAGITR